MNDKSNLWQGARRLVPAATPTSAVLLLHGLGSNADDLIGIAPYLTPQLPHTVFISPNAPQACDMAPYGHQWFRLQQRSEASLWQGVEQARSSLERMIAEVKAEFNLPASKIALVGFSQGAMMALHVAPRLEEQLGAVIGLSGVLVSGEKLEAEIRSRPPVLLAHGHLDDVLPFAAMPAAAAVLQRNNIAVETVARAQMAHSIDDVVLARSADFLKAHLG